MRPSILPSKTPLVQNGVEPQASVLPNASAKVARTLDRKAGYLDFCVRLWKLLEEPGIPDFSFFAQDGIGAFLSKFLREELDREKAWFDKLMRKDAKSVRYRDLSSDSCLDTLWWYVTYVDQSTPTPEISKVVEDFMEEYSNFSTSVSLNREYYRILKSVVDDPEIPDDERASLRKGIREMEKNGVHLHPQNKRKLAELYDSLAVACRKYDETLADAEDSFTFIIEDRSCLSEMPESMLEAARVAAEEDGADGFLFWSDPDSNDAVLRYCSDRELREEYFRLSTSIASEGDFDNRENALEIVRLQGKIAEILWYPDAWTMLLADTMAKTREGVMAFVDPYREKARVAALAELESLRRFSGLDRLERWDVAYYSRLQFDELSEGITESEFLPYFHFERVLSGVLETSRALFGVSFEEVPAPNSLPWVRHYRVAKSGRDIGYLVFDPFDREGKSGGSSATVIREKSAFFDVKPLAKEDRPAWRLKKKSAPLLSDSLGDKKFALPICGISCDFVGTSVESWHFSMESAATLFHEFWHVIHFLADDSELPENSGYHCQSDFIEIPSQMLEKWLTSPAMLEKHLVDGSGRPIDRERFKKYLSLKRTFHSARGFLMDLAVIRADLDVYSAPVPKDYDELNRRFQDAIRRESVTGCEEWTQYPTWFAHIFSGMYSSVYSSYLLGDIAVEDLFQRLRESAKASANAWTEYYEKVLAPGNKVDGSEILESYLWRIPRADAYFRHIGVICENQS